MSETAPVEFQRYRTPVLFVLVGENPLPNYVAAKLLLPDKGRLFLVHSKGPAGTGKIANRLRAHLAQYEPHLVPVDEFDASELRQALEPYLDNLKPDAVGLHYTGGTKFMAVHTYRSVAAFCQQRGRDLILSYLHADTLQLTVEPRPGDPGLCRSVVEAVHLDLADVFALHGVDLIDPGRTEARLPELAGAVAAFQCSSRAVKLWRNGVKLLLESEGRPWPDVRRALLDGGLPEPLLDQMAASFFLAGADPLNLADIAGRTGLGTIGSLANWLHWQWLEDWTLACVPRAVKPHDPIPRAGNLRGRSGGTYSFEIDVAFMRGYQFFAVSCKDTTSRTTAKLGLMEAFARARQMGGEEGRAALVTTYEDATGVRAEFAADWGASRRVRVFGCGELPDLALYLQDWYRNPEAAD